MTTCKKCLGRGTIDERHAPDIRFPKVFRYIQIFCSECKGSGVIGGI